VDKKTYRIIRNLGFNEPDITSLREIKSLDKKTLSFFKKLNLPGEAIKQIKDTENYSIAKIDNLSNEELKHLLVKKCKRSFDAFARKKIKAVVIFKENESWILYSAAYDKYIQNFHMICKSRFDELESLNLSANVLFNGTEKWLIT